MKNLSFVIWLLGGYFGERILYITQLHLNQELPSNVSTIIKFLIWFFVAFLILDLRKTENSKLTQKGQINTPLKGSNSQNKGKIR